MDKHRIYIDETGNSDMASSDNPNHRFLSLTGIIMNLTYVDISFHQDFENFKKQFFAYHPDEPLILHRKELVNKQHPFHILNDPAVEIKFNNCLINKLTEWNYRIITVIIDKKEHSEMYKTWKYDPYHYCLAVLIERFLFYLEENNFMGDVIIEARGGKEDNRLKDSFNNLYEKGTQYVKTELFQKRLTSCQLKVKPKVNNISGLQLADLLAHPSRRHALLEYGLLSRDKEIFSDKIIEVIKPKYIQKNGKIAGYGIKKLP